MAFDLGSTLAARPSRISYCGLELWDNTMFPAVEAGLHDYASLVMLSSEAADEHAAKVRARVRVRAEVRVRVRI